MVCAEPLGGKCICGTQPEIEDAQGRNPNCKAGTLLWVDVWLPVEDVSAPYEGDS